MSARSHAAPSRPVFPAAHCGVPFSLLLLFLLFLLLLLLLSGEAERAGPIGSLVRFTENDSRVHGFELQVRTSEALHWPRSQWRRHRAQALFLAAQPVGTRGKRIALRLRSAAGGLAADPGQALRAVGLHQGTRGELTQSGCLRSLAARPSWMCPLPGIASELDAASHIQVGCAP